MAAAHEYEREGPAFRDKQKQRQALPAVFLALRRAENSL